MSIIEFRQHLETIAPTYYMHPVVDENNKQPQLPYIVYIPQANYTLADNKNYTKHNSYTLEYYFDIKDEELENKLENKLNEMGFTFSRSEDTWVDGLFLIYYYV